MKKKPLITVVIPVYNGAKYLKRTTESLRQQDFADFEVLFVDDSSTDESAKILQQYQLVDDRFKLIQLSCNQGIVPKVLNKILPQINGEYYVYSSQDDYYSKDWLAKMYEKAVQTGADAVLPDVIFAAEGGKSLEKAICGVKGRHDLLLAGREAFELSLSWEISTNALWRTQIVRDVGYYDFGMYADEYSARVFFLKCNIVAFCNAKFFYSQDNSDAITKKNQ